MTLQSHRLRIQTQHAIQNVSKVWHIREKENAFVHRLATVTSVNVYLIKAASVMQVLTGGGGSPVLSISLN